MIVDFRVEREAAFVQITWLTAVSVAFAFGFLLGYFVRAMISRRRHRLSSQRRRRHAGGEGEQQFALGLQRSTSQDGTSESELRSTSDAPGLAGLDLEEREQSDLPNRVGGPAKTAQPGRRRRPGRK